MSKRKAEVIGTPTLSMVHKSAWSDLSPSDLVVGATYWETGSRCGRRITYVQPLPLMGGSIDYIFRTIKGPDAQLTAADVAELIRLES